MITQKLQIRHEVLLRRLGLFHRSIIPH